MITDKNLRKMINIILRFGIIAIYVLLILGFIFSSKFLFFGIFVLLMLAVIKIIVQGIGFSKDKKQKFALLSVASLIIFIAQIIIFGIFKL